MATRKNSPSAAKVLNPKIALILENEINNQPRDWFNDETGETCFDRQGPNPCDGCRNVALLDSMLREYGA